MNATLKFAAWLMIASLAGMRCAGAEDIDIFLSNPATTGTRPNVLLVLDNAASNNSNITGLDGTSTDKLTMLSQVLDNIADPLNSPYFPPCTVAVDGTRTPAGCFLRTEIDALLKNINLGLMVFNPSGSTKGGYVRYRVQPMDVAANRTALVAKFTPIDAANNAPYASSLYEAYLYYGGKPAYAGFDSSLYDKDAKNGNNYVSPATDSCQNNYIVFVGNGGPDAGEDKNAGSLLNAIGGKLNTDPVSFSPSNYKNNWLDETARTLKSQDVVPSLAGVQNVTTYTIAIQNPADNNYGTAPMQSARALLQSAAALGGGEYFEANNGQAVMNAFVNLLSKFQSVNSVFAASTLPVSVNVRGNFLNQVYMGQFRPNADASPRWPGNLKQYQIALDAAGQPVLADRFGKGIEDTVNGFILPDKTSFWTTASTYWAFSPLGNPASSSDAPDGNIVEKGGVEQRLRQDFATSQSARKLYTCAPACSTSGSALSGTTFDDATTAITAAMLTPPSQTTLSATDRTALIDWVRGADNIDNEDGNGVATDIRARIHGDLLHSRPAVVNYNRYNDNNDIMIYYGANDGIFHAIKGGQSDTDGGEKWGMIFPEFFGSLKRLRDNSPDISAATPKPYYADGPVSVYQNDVNNDGKLVATDGDKVYLYIGMRRGGRFVYALDASDPTAPKFLWKLDASTTGFGELGQTWSNLRPAKIAASSDPVVIFGAGYDAASEDAVPATTDTMGRGIFVVNAKTGALISLIQPSGMGSVPGDVAVVDRDGDGNFDRIYAGDTKGNVWRVDINDADPTKWTSHELASLGGSGTDARKFLNKPDVVFGKTYDAVLIGAGDREHPFDTTVTNRFYMLKDSNIGLTGGSICTDAATGAGRPCVESDLTDVTSDPFQNVAATIPTGWYLTLAAGEKVVGNAVTVFGTTYFGTNRPTPPATGVCSSNLGEAKIYAVGFEAGTATTDTNNDGVVDSNDIAEVIKGGGFPPSPIYARTDVTTPDGKIVPVDTVCTGSHCITPPHVVTDTKRYRTYWHIEQ